MSQPGKGVDTKGFMSGTWSMVTSGPCAAPPTNGFLSLGVGKHLIDACQHTISVPKTPWLPRKPTPWWSRHGIAYGPMLHISGKKTITNTCPPIGLVTNLQSYSAVEIGGPSSLRLLPNLTEPFNGGLLAATTNEMLNLIGDDTANLSLAFAERKKVENLFVSTAKSIAASVRNFRRRYPRDWEKVKDSRRGEPRYTRKRDTWLASDRTLPGPVRDIPNRWLELQYGWKPLMSDVEGACRELSRLQADNLFLFSKRKRKSVRGTDWSTALITTDNQAKYRIKYIRKDVCDIQLWYRIKSDVLASYSSLGLTNPALLAWELLPYSFVIDWFLPIGNWLNTWDATLGKTLYAGYTSQAFFLGEPYLEKVQPATLVGWSLSTRWPDPPLAHYVSHNRDIHLTFPSPFPPSFKDPASPTHVANGLSLLVTAFSGRGNTTRL